MSLGLKIGVLDHPASLSGERDILKFFLFSIQFSGCGKEYAAPRRVAHLQTCSAICSVHA